MQISASFLSVKTDLGESIKLLDKTNIDYIHLDIMDGIFVKNKSFTYSELSDKFTNINKLLDIHLMVQDVKKYVDNFSKLSPEFITFHYEVGNVDELINYIKIFCKVGLSIKPTTDIKEITPYLDKIDLVLLMSVDPGYGEQKYIDDITIKINELKNIREQKKLKFLIEVDGGININTINKVVNADIAVVGSYITNGNYNERVNSLK